MAWEDIDFDLIVPGMITRGPALVSFAEYLTQFSRALDEKQNMVQTGTPVLSEIPFEVNEIRNEGTFFNNFRALIEGYRVLWYSSVFYDSAVLTDATNYPDYLITDALLEVALGPEAWEILNDHSTMSNQDIFKASILNGFYVIYLNTKVINKTPGSTSDTITQNRPTIRRSDGMFENIADPDEVQGAPSEAYSSVRDDILSGISENDTTRLNSDNTFAFTYLAQRREIGSPTFEWKIGYAEFGTTKDKMIIDYLYKDLDDNVLSMNAVPLFEMTANIVSWENLTVPDSGTRAFDTTWPEWDGSGTDPYEVIEPQTVATGTSTVQTFYYNDTGGADFWQPQDLEQDGNVEEFYTELQQLIFKPPTDFIFVELNNPDL